MGYIASSQAHNGSTAGATSISVTLPVACSVGDVVLAMCSCESGGTAYDISSVTSSNISWSNVITFDHSGNNQRYRLYRGKVTTGFSASTESITANFSGGSPQYRHIDVVAYTPDSGKAYASEPAQQSGADTYAAASNPTGADGYSEVLTTTGSGSFDIVGLMVCEETESSVLGDCDPGTGMTLRGSVHSMFGDVTGAMPFLWMDKDQASSGATTVYGQFVQTCTYMSSLVAVALEMQSNEVPTGTSGGLVVGSATSFVGEGFVGSIESETGAYTLVAAQGSYSLSGQAAGLRASRILTAAQGSYSLTGQDAALRKTYPLIAAQGSYSLNGQSANLVVTRVLAAAQGSYALTGQAANLVYGKTLTAAQGAYSLTGQDAALRVTRTMVAGQGSYNLSGQAANLFAARQVTAEQGAYSLTGMAAGLLYSGASPTLIAGMGSYSLTGQDVALRRTAILLAAQGDYTITGQVAGLRADRVLSAATGFYTLTGEPADLLVTIPPAVTLPPAGGDDVPDRGHRGWDRKRSRLKLHREREFTEQIRDLYRELTGDPRTAARAEAILAPIVAAVPAAGESEAAREAALEARAEALRARADALEADAMQAEIALRLLHRELRDWQEDDDLEAIQLLLSQVL